MGKNHIGEEHINKEGYSLEVIGYENYNNCTIRFSDGGIWSGIRYSEIKYGSVKNPNKITVCGVGYLGRRKTIKTTKFEIYIYKRWLAMLKRCYDPKTLEKQPTYKEVSVCDEWLCYDTFREWFIKNYVEGYQLDKDILSVGTKIYSPETCVFVPKEINLLFNVNKNNRSSLPLGVIRNVKTNGYGACINIQGKANYLGIYDSQEEAFNAYRKAKKEHILSIAKKWKDKIDHRVYDYMIKYDININS